MKIFQLELSSSEKKYFFSLDSMKDAIDGEIDGENNDFEYIESYEDLSFNTIFCFKTIKKLYKKGA